MFSLYLVTTLYSPCDRLWKKNAASAKCRFVYFSSTLIGSNGACRNVKTLSKSYYSIKIGVLYFFTITYTIWIFGMVFSARCHERSINVSDLCGKIKKVIVNIFMSWVKNSMGIQGPWLYLKFGEILQSLLMKIAGTSFIPH